MSQALTLVLYVAVILFVILVHEAGHYFTAKAFKIRVEEFFLGFGPRLWSFRRGGTEYGVKGIPLGGYVRIAGMNPLQEVPPEDYAGTFGSKPIWQRAIVIATGPVSHFALAILALAIYLAAIGLPRFAPVVNEVQATLGGRESPASQAGLRAGDRIVEVGGRPVSSQEDFVAFIRSHVGEPVSITILRDGRRMTVSTTPVLSSVEGRRIGRLGVVLGGGVMLGRDRASPVQAAGRAVAQTWSMAKAVVLRLGDVFGPSGLRRIGQLVAGSERRRVDDPASLVGAGRLAAQAAQAGVYDVLLGLFVSFNVFVGIMNLLPLPPLDGGHLAVLAVEGVTRRRVDVRRLIPVTALVTGFLIIFMFSLVYLDIVSPLPDPFR